MLDTSNPPRVKNFREKAHKDIGPLLKLFKPFKLFALSGIMLGAVREGDFIEHDWDIDLGSVEMPSPEDQLYLADELRAMRYKPDFQMSKKSGRIQLKKRVPTDIHFFEVEGDNLVCKIWEEPLLSIPAKYYNISKAKLGNKKIDILDKGYLDNMYKDWKTPMRTNYFKDDYTYIK